MTEEEIKALQQELEQAKAEVAKLTDIKKEAFSVRDEYKKKYTEAETQIATYEQTVAKTEQQLEAERKKREEIVALHTSTIKVSAIRQALEKEGVIAMDTALKLVPLDKITVDEAFGINNSTVAEVITALRESDGILFRAKGAPTVDTDDVPKPKRAAEGEPKAGFTEELKNCKTAAEIEALLKRHGKV